MVWTGKDAKDLGLIDVLGGLEDAISIAASMANIENYRIINLPKLKNPFEKILTEFGGQVKQKIIKSELGPSFPIYQQFEELKKMDRLQMRIPMQFEIY